MNDMAELQPDPLAVELTETRAQFLSLCEPLAIEDYSLQAAPFASPPKWHLAHTTWFFETFLLKPFLEGYSTPHPLYEQLFNSYYNGIGQQHPRAQRGLLSRPTLEEVRSYRTSVDTALQELLSDQSHPERATILTRVRLGIEHERQHQELFCTDLKYSLAANPLLPVYRECATAAVAAPAEPQRWRRFEGGLTQTGHSDNSFCFDNELPRHNCHLEPFLLADRLVTNGEYENFIADDGYQRPELWLADGWDKVQQDGWAAPQYWLERDGESFEFTLHGLQPRQSATPVCHISGYEAEAYARWAKARLPTEQEWECAARSAPAPQTSATAERGLDSGYFHPRAAHPRTAGGTDALQQLYDSCWQWTRSAYAPYPGFRAASDAIGEYNGKFMSNQWVLRGGSCVSKREQLRPTYRNFFYPDDRWQFSGLRLARDAENNRDGDWDGNHP